MNIQWYVAKNGTVSGPFSLIESQKYVADNENVYVWQANFMQWQAASQVAEFTDFVKGDQVVPVAPKGLIEKFSVKKKRVYSKLSTCSEKFSQSEKALEELSGKIESYKTITSSLSPAVQGAISTTEKRYNRLVSKVSTLTSVFKNAEEELIAVSDEFEGKNALSSKKTVTEAPKEEVTAQDKSLSKEESIALAMKSAEDEFLAKFSAKDSGDKILDEAGAPEITAKVEDDALAELASEAELSAEFAKLNAELDAEESVNTTPEKADHLRVVSSDDTSKSEGKSLFSSTKEAASKTAAKVSGIQGVKGFKEANKLFKQVFNPNEQEESVPLSQQLKQLPKDETAVVHDISEKAQKEEVEVEHVVADEDTEQNKKRRRRR